MKNNEIPLNFRLLAIAFHAIGALMPITSIPITWVLWLVTREIDPFVDQSGRSALNFQTTIALYVIVAFGLLGVICGVLPTNVGQSIANIIFYPVVFVVALLLFASFVLPLVAIILAFQGKIYSYPLTIKFLSETL